MSYKGYSLRKTKEEEALSRLQGPVWLGCENPSPLKAQASRMQSPRSWALPLHYPGQELGLEVHGSAELLARPLGLPLPQRRKSEVPEMAWKGDFKRIQCQRLGLSACPYLSLLPGESAPFGPPLPACERRHEMSASPHSKQVELSVQRMLLDSRAPKGACPEGLHRGEEPWTGVRMRPEGSGRTSK